MGYSRFWVYSLFFDTKMFASNRQKQQQHRYAQVLLCNGDYECLEENLMSSLSLSGGVVTKWDFLLKKQQHKTICFELCLR